jgi:hypothetical protein
MEHDGARGCHHRSTVVPDSGRNLQMDRNSSYQRGRMMDRASACVASFRYGLYRTSHVLEHSMGEQRYFLTWLCLSGWWSGHNDCAQMILCQLRDTWRSLCHKM